MSNLVIPDGGNIGSASDTDAITISSTGKVTTADSELNVKTTSHTFTVKGIDSAISDSQSGTAPDTTDSDSGQFAVYTGSTKLFGITEHGYFLKPNQPSFRVTANNLSSTTAFPFPWNVVEHNEGNHYSTSTHRFTAPINGVYLFTMNVFKASTSSDAEALITVNGTTKLYARDQDNSAGYGNLSGSLMIKLSAGDYVQSGRYGGTIHINHTTGGMHFAGHLLG